MVWRMIGFILISTSVVGAWQAKRIFDEHPHYTTIALYEKARISFMVFTGLFVVGILMLHSAVLIFATLGMITMLWGITEGIRFGVKFGLGVVIFGVALQYTWIF